MHMSDAAIEFVLRRDRVIVASALFLLVALAWTYILWLAAGMDMGDMDMSGSRMIPTGMALMMPAIAPWNAIVLVEKLIPAGRVSRVVGAAFFVGGIWMLAHTF